MNTQFFTFNFIPPGAAGETPFVSSAPEETLLAGDCARGSQFDEEFSALLQQQSSPAPAGSVNGVAQTPSAAEAAAIGTLADETPKTPAADLPETHFDENATERFVTGEAPDIPFEETAGIPVPNEAATLSEQDEPVGAAAAREKFAPAEQRSAPVEKFESAEKPAADAAAEESTPDEKAPASPRGGETAPDTFSPSAAGESKPVLPERQNVFADLSIRLDAGESSEPPLAEVVSAPPDRPTAAETAGPETPIPADENDFSIPQETPTTPPRSHFEDEKRFLQGVAAEIKAADAGIPENFSAPLTPGENNPGVPAPAKSAPGGEQSETTRTPGEDSFSIPLKKVKGIFSPEQVGDILTPARPELNFQNYEPARPNNGVPSGEAPTAAPMNRLAEENSLEAARSGAGPAASSPDGEIVNALPEVAEPTFQIRETAATSNDSRLFAEDAAALVEEDSADGLGIDIGGAKELPQTVSWNEIKIPDEIPEEESGATEKETAGFPNAFSPAPENNPPRGWGFESGKIFLQKVAAKIKAKVELPDSNSKAAVPPTPESAQGAETVEKNPSVLNTSDPNPQAAAREISQTAVVVSPEEAFTAAASYAGAARADKNPAPFKVAVSNVNTASSFNENLNSPLQPKLSFQLDFPATAQTTVAGPAVNAAAAPAVTGNPLLFVENAVIGSRQNMFADFKIRLDGENNPKSQTPEDGLRTAGSEIAAGAAESVRPVEAAAAAANGNDLLRFSRFEDGKLFLQSVAARIKASDKTPDNSFASLLSGSPSPARTGSEVAAAGGSAPASQSPQFAETLGEQIEAPILEMARDSAADEQPRSVRLRLNPEELGAIEIRIETRAGGELHAHLRAETQTARQMLSENIGQLQKTLENAGWQVERLEVSAGQTDSAFFGNGSAADHRNQREQAEFLSSARNHHLPDPEGAGGGESGRTTSSSSGPTRPDKIVSVHA